MSRERRLAVSFPEDRLSCLDAFAAPMGYSRPQAVRYLAAFAARIHEELAALDPEAAAAFRWNFSVPGARAMARALAPMLASFPAVDIPEKQPGNREPARIIAFRRNP